MRWLTDTELTPQTFDPDISKTYINGDLRSDPTDRVRDSILFDSIVIADPLGLLGTARSSLAWGLAAAATRLLRLSCREPPIHDADPSVQLAGDFIDRHPGGAQAVGLLDPASIVGDSTASATKFGIRPLSRANSARDFKGRVAVGTFHEPLEQVDREGELQP